MSSSCFLPTSDRLKFDACQFRRPVNYERKRVLFNGVLKEKHNVRAVPLRFQLNEEEKTLLRDSSKGYKVRLYICTDPDSYLSGEKKEKTVRISLPPQMTVKLNNHHVYQEVRHFYKNIK